MERYSVVFFAVEFEKVAQKTFCYKEESAGDLILGMPAERALGV